MENEVPNKGSSPPPPKWKIPLGRILTLFFGLILPLIFLVLGVVIFVYTASQGLPKTSEVEVLEKAALVPSDVLNHQSDYSSKRIDIRGRVAQAPVVCDKKACPIDDPCCGCPADRGLILADPGTVINTKSGARLELVNVNGNKFCQRLPQSCSYSCPGWSTGSIYDVQGVFYSEPPPPGWNISLNFYLTVEDANEVKEVRAEERVRTVFEEIRDKIVSFFSSGMYVLP